MTNNTPDYSRRQFLKNTGWTFAGITVVASLPGCGLIPALPSRDMPTGEDSLSWLQLQPDGQFYFCSPRQEMGQGILASLKLILADELGVEPHQITTIGPDTGKITPVKSTVGSESIKDFAHPVARLGATMIKTLKQHAAPILQTDDRTLEFDGHLFHFGARTVSLSELAATSPLLMDRNTALVEETHFLTGTPRHVGKPSATENIRSIVTGEPLYAGDIRLPDMAYGAMLRPPTLNAKLKSVDMAPLPAGAVLASWQENGQAGLVAATPALLFQALELVETSWVTSDIATQVEIDQALSLRGIETGDLEHSILDGVIPQQTAWDIDHTISIPFAAHASIEPRVAVARWNSKGTPRLEVWTGTQDAFFVRATLAQEFGLPEDDVAVYSQRIGGAFGGKTLCTVEREAAVLAKSADRPVKVHWTRPDEFQMAHHRPPSMHRVRASLNPDGTIESWDHGFKSGHVIFTSAAMPQWMQSLTSFAPDPGAARGATPPYKGSHMQVAFSDMRLPVLTGPWRGLGAAPNCFAIETSIDLLAKKAGKDPIAFRTANLKGSHPRLAHCLTEVARLSNWAGSSKSATRYRGAACGIYKEVTYVAVVADIDIDPETQSFQVAKLYCAHDCGTIINPDQVRAQIEGNLVWGIGMATQESFHLQDSRISADYLGDYEIPTIGDVPDIAIKLVTPEGAAPAGAGEAAITAAAAAISNAFFAATGQPVTKLPIEPDSHS